MLEKAGEVGGLLVVVFGMGYLLTACCARRTLEQNLIRDSFQTQKFAKDRSDYSNDGKEFNDGLQSEKNSRGTTPGINQV